MKPTDRARGFRAADVHLGDPAITPGLGKRRLLDAEGIEKRAAVIDERLAHQLKHASDWGRAKLSWHGFVPRGYSRIKRLPATAL